MDCITLAQLDAQRHSQTSVGNMSLHCSTFLQFSCGMLGTCHIGGLIFEIYIFAFYSIYQKVILYIYVAGSFTQTDTTICG